MHFHFSHFTIFLSILSIHTQYTQYDPNEAGKLNQVMINFNQSVVRHSLFYTTATPAMVEGGIRIA